MARYLTGSGPSLRPLVLGWCRACVPRMLCIQGYTAYYGCYTETRTSPTGLSSALRSDGNLCQYLHSSYLVTSHSRYPQGLRTCSVNVHVININGRWVPDPHVTGGMGALITMLWRCYGDVSVSWYGTILGTITER